MRARNQKRDHSSFLDDLLDGRPALIVDSHALRRALRRRARERAREDLRDAALERAEWGLR